MNALSNSTIKYLSSLVYSKHAEMRSNLIPLRGLYWADEIPNFEALVKMAAETRGQIYRLFQIRYAIWAGFDLSPKDIRFLESARLIVPDCPIFRRLVPTEHISQAQQMIREEVQEIYEMMDSTNKRVDTINEDGAIKTTWLLTPSPVPKLEKMNCPHCQEPNAISFDLTPPGTKVICNNCAKLFDLPEETLATADTMSEEDKISEKIESCSLDDSLRNLVLSDNKKNILLIEKDRSITRFISEELEERYPSQVQVVAIKEGFKALKFLLNRNQKIQLIISTIQLNDIDGIKILKICKDRYPDIPFIFHTPYEFRDDLPVAAADAYIVMQSDLTELFDSVERAIKIAPSK